MQTTFRIGQYVRLVAPVGIDAAVGRIVALETYTDFQGSRTWFYVSWFKADGARGDVEKCHEQELIHHDEV